MDTLQNKLTETRALAIVSQSSTDESKGQEIAAFIEKLQVDLDTLIQTILQKSAVSDIDSFRDLVKTAQIAFDVYEKMSMRTIRQQLLLNIYKRTNTAPVGMDDDQRFDIAEEEKELEASRKQEEEALRLLEVYADKVAMEAEPSRILVAKPIVTLNK